VALWRLEQLYPFPRRALEQQLRAQPGLKELVWAQEEHLNQGAWQGVRDELAGLRDRWRAPASGGPADECRRRNAVDRGAPARAA
jgi:2-oxoglutarate dehydrogenase complex dehydrogenase (E1) component-like enzyme